MRCNNCGTEVADGVSQCPVCGNKIIQGGNGFNQQTQTQGQTPFYQQNGANPTQGTAQAQPNFDNTNVNNGFDQTNPNDPGFQTNNFGQPNYTSQSQGFNGQQGFNAPQRGYLNAPEFWVLLITGIVLTLCCCSWVTGIGTIVCAVLMNEGFKAGNQHDYLLFRKIAIILIAVAIGIKILSIIIGWVSGFIGALFS